MTDIRNEKTRNAIKEAMISLMETQALDTISVAALAQAAGVSRSTFYCHFKNTYEVYELLVDDFLNSVSSMESQVKCSSCLSASSGKLPYCVAIRNTEKYRNVVRDRQYVSTMLRAYQGGPCANEGILPYRKLGLDDHSAKVLLAFQMAGCHMAAMMERTKQRWPQDKKLLDTFIAGGMNAVAALH